MSPRPLLSTTVAMSMLALVALLGTGCGSDSTSSTAAEQGQKVTAAVAKRLTAACEKTAAAALALSKAGDQATSAALTNANNAVDNIAVSLATVTVPDPAKKAWAAVVQHLGDASDALDDGIAAVVQSDGARVPKAALDTATREVDKAVSSFVLLSGEAGFRCPLR